MADTGFTRPTIGELVARARADLAANVTDSRAFVRRSLEWGLAKMSGGAHHLIYGAIANVAMNAFADLAIGVWLERLASVFGITRQIATNGFGGVTFTAAGVAAVPAGTQLTDVDGNEYETRVHYNFPGAGTHDISVAALSLGLDTNLGAGAALIITTPILLVDSNCTVAADFTGGADEESDDDIRARLLYRMAHVPQGGAEADYVIWAQEVEGVDSVWPVVPVAHLPTIAVIYSGTAAEVDVQAYLDDTTRKPMNAVPTAASVETNPSVQFDTAFTIEGHLETGAVQADVEDAIEDQINALYGREGGPDTAVWNSDLRGAIGDAAGLDWFTLDDINADGDGLSDLVSGATTVQHMATPIVFTWV